MQDQHKSSLDDIFDIITKPESDYMTREQFKQASNLLKNSDYLVKLENTNSLNNWFLDLQIELIEARKNFPTNKHRLAAFSEEAGELAKALLEHEKGNVEANEVYREAIQAAAMAIRVATEGDSNFNYKPIKNESNN